MKDLPKIPPSHTALVTEDGETRLVRGWVTLKGVIATLVPPASDKSVAVQQYEFVSDELDYQHPAYKGEGLDESKVYVFFPKRYDDFVLLTPEEAEVYSMEQGVKYEQRNN